MENENIREHYLYVQQIDHLDLKGDVFIIKHAASCLVTV